VKKALVITVRRFIHFIRFEYRNIILMLR
jgi:hypothetical protein